jgi:hypothetical protein
MKTLSVITTALFLAFGVATSRAQNPERISTATGVPIETLQAERTSTGLGWGSLEKAHLLSNATGQSFDDVVALHQSGHGWGKIAHDNGLNLGRLVSNANRSSQATAHAQNLNTVHGKSTASHGRNATGRGKSTTMHGRSANAHGRSATNIGRGHPSRMTANRSVGHRSNFGSGFGASHGMRSMGHMSASHGTGSMGHGGRGR